MAEEDNIFKDIQNNSGSFWGSSDIQSGQNTQGEELTKLIAGNANALDWTGTVNINRGTHPNVPYARTPFESLTRKTSADVFVENAPYYAAIGTVGLVSGGVLSGAALGITEGLGLSALASETIGATAFTLGALGGGGAAEKGLNTAGFDAPTESDIAFNPGAIASAQILPTAALFRPALPTAQTVRSGLVFGGVVGAESLINSGLNDQVSTTGEVLSSAGLHAVEGAAFGAFGKPTALGGPIMQKAHSIGANNSVVNSAVRSLYGVTPAGGVQQGAFGRGLVATDQASGNLRGVYETTPISENGTIGGPAEGKMPFESFRGQTELPPEVGPGLPGSGPAAAASGGGGLGPSMAEPARPNLVPSANNAGEATHYDPANGSLVITSTLPNGNIRVTTYTNLGPKGLKETGPYKDAPDVFTMELGPGGQVVNQNPGEPGLTPRFNRPTDKAAADAARAAARAGAVDVEEVVPPAPKPPEPAAANQPIAGAIPEATSTPPVAPAPRKPVVPQNENKPVNQTETGRFIAVDYSVEPPPAAPPSAPSYDKKDEFAEWSLRYGQLIQKRSDWFKKYGNSHDATTGKPFSQSVVDKITNQSVEPLPPPPAEKPSAAVPAAPTQLEPGHVEPNIAYTKPVGLLTSAEFQSMMDWNKKYSDTHNLDGTPREFRGRSDAQIEAEREAEKKRIEDERKRQVDADLSKPTETLESTIPAPKRQDYGYTSSYGVPGSPKYEIWANTPDGKQFIEDSKLWYDAYGDKFNSDGSRKKKPVATTPVATPETEQPQAAPKPTTPTQAGPAVAAPTAEKPKFQNPIPTGDKGGQLGLPGTENADFNLAGERIPPPKEPAPPVDTTTGELPGVGGTEPQASKPIPVASIQDEKKTVRDASLDDLRSGKRAMDEAPEEVIRTMTDDDRQEYFKNRGEFLRTQVQNTPTVESDKPKKEKKERDLSGNRSHEFEPDSITDARNKIAKDKTLSVPQTLLLQDKVDQHDEELKLLNRDESVNLEKVSDNAIKEFQNEQLVRSLTGEYTERDSLWDQYITNEVERRANEMARVDQEQAKTGGVHGDLLADLRSITRTYPWPKLPEWMKDEENNAILAANRILQFRTAFPRTLDQSRTDLTHKEDMKNRVLEMFSPIIQRLEQKGWTQLSETESVTELIDLVRRAHAGEKLTPLSGIGGNVDRETAVKKNNRKFAQHPVLVKRAAETKKLMEKLLKQAAEGKPQSQPETDENNPFSTIDPGDTSPEAEAVRKAQSRQDLPQSVPETPAEQWKKAGRPKKVKPVSDIPPAAKSKAEQDFDAGNKAAKPYTGRFNIGGEKNPDGFGGEIRGEKGVKVASDEKNWSPENLQLIRDYLSPAAAEIRNLGYPKFYLNTHNSGQESNWVSAAIPVGNGNYVIYEVNPKDAGRSGNSYATMARLFRKFVNSSGQQIGQQTEVRQFAINGFETKSLAPDGKALFKVPAVFHAQMVAGQDLISAKAMNVTEETLASSQSKPLDGNIHTDLQNYEEEELTPPGLRQKMEIFNATNGGDTINRAIMAVITNVTDSNAHSTLINALSIYAKMSPGDAKQFVVEIVEAQTGPSKEDSQIVVSPRDISEYEQMKVQSIWPSEAGQIAAWAKNGYKRIIFEVGRDDPHTGEELPDQVQANDEQGNPRWKKKLGPNGEQVPFMISNPKKWNVQFVEWMNKDTFANGTFTPTPHQVKGVNMAMTRFWPTGADTKPREYGGSGLPRGFAIFDAPGTGKTLQMLMTAKLYRDQLKKQTLDPNSPWYGHKAQPVLIVTQNTNIIIQAFQGDAKLAGIALNGTFDENGFTPNEYTIDSNGGRILSGESWIDIATYNSIKPEMKMVPVFNKDGTPKMVPKYAVDENGDYIPSPVDGKRFQQIDPKTGEGMVEQATERAPAGPPKKGSGFWGCVMFDESHNMKNDESGRADAGFELLTRAQHTIMASGTPLDKPQQAAILMAMLLDRPITEAAALTGMSVSYGQRKAEKIRLSEPGFTPAMSKIRLTCTGGGWGGTPEERFKQFQKCYTGMRMLRDECGKNGAILRRGTKFFGNPNIWVDPTDGMHENARAAIFEMQRWWEEQIALEKEAGGGGMRVMHLIGQSMFESKRLTALCKLGIPGSPWNPDKEARGVSKVLLNELAEGRKVVITVDTSNLFNMQDTVSIRRFKGLQDDNGDNLPYESESVLLMRWLDSIGVKHGSITGNFDQLERMATIDAFQKNSPELQVIIMTIQSGGTGLSIDDRSGTGGKFGVKKAYTPEELDKMVAMSAGQIPGEKTETGSFPRSVLITSSPWGGDVFIQAMGRTDRMLSSSPTRIYAFTSHISNGDERLRNLVREKINTTNSMIETGDPIEAEVHSGMVDDGGNPIVTAEGPVGATEKSDEQLKYEKSSAGSFLRGELGMVNHLIKKKEDTIKNRLPKNEDEWDAKDNANSKRWNSELAALRDRALALKQHMTDLEAGVISGATVLNNKDSFKGTKEETEVNEDGEEETYDQTVLPIIGNETISDPMVIKTGHKKDTVKNRILDNIYGIQARIAGGKVTAERAEKITDKVVKITAPFLKMHAQGKITRLQIGAILRMARDIAFLLTDTQFVFEERTVEQQGKLGKGGEANLSANAILTILADRGNVDVEKTLFHEIGHILFRYIPDSVKAEMLDELNNARQQWLNSMAENDPRRSVITPTINWNRTNGEDRYTLEESERTGNPVLGAPSRTYKFRKFKHKAPYIGQNSDPLVGAAYSGIMITSKALDLALESARIAFPGKFGKNKPYFLKIHSDYKESTLDSNPDKTRPIGGSGIGAEGQLDIVKAGKTEAQNVGMLVTSLLQMGLLNTTAKDGQERWRGTSVDSELFIPSTGKTVNMKVNLAMLQQMFNSKGNSYTTVGEDGVIKIVAGANENLNEIASKHNYIGSNRKLIEIKIDSSQILSELLKAFVNVRENWNPDTLGKLLKPVELTDWSSGADNENEVAKGTFSPGRKPTRYELTNLDEWCAVNTERLMADYYGSEYFNEFTHLQAAITSSLYVHASYAKNASITRSILARIMSGEFTTENKNLGGMDYIARSQGRFVEMQQTAAQSGSTSPPSGETQASIFKPENVSDDDGIVMGRGASLSASASRVAAEAHEILERIKSNMAGAALYAPIGGNLKTWLEGVRRRKKTTGNPDSSKGVSAGYVAGSFLGTVIGQLENIAQITKNEEVAELAKRLYPSQNTGLLAKPTFSEDYLASRMYWNNVFESIIEKNLGKTINASTKVSNRVLRSSEVKNKSPEFINALKQYFLRVHNADYNKLERMRDEAEGLISENQSLTQALNNEMREMNVKSVQDIKSRIKTLEDQAEHEARLFGTPAGKFSNIVLGREADHFLSQFMHGGTIDKLMMDVGRCMAISPTHPDYNRVEAIFGKDVVSCANELSYEWAHKYRKWVESRTGEEIYDYGSSWRPRIIDAHVICDGPEGRKEHFIQEAARAFLADNNKQRVTLPIEFQSHFKSGNSFAMDFALPNGASASDWSNTKAFIVFSVSKLAIDLPDWMESRALEIVSGGRRHQFRDGMGFDVDCSTASYIPISGGKENTSNGQLIRIQLIAYREKLARMCKEEFGTIKEARQSSIAIDEEFVMIERAMKRLAESHTRKVVEHKLTSKDAYALARAMFERINHRTTGVASSGDGYSDIFSGQHGTLKRPDSLKGRLMDTEAADDILGQFYIQDPRVFGPHYNKSVTRNVMIKHYIPESFFQNLQKSVVSDEASKAYWSEIVYAIRKITESESQHDTSTLVRTAATLVAANIFMPMTAMLQVLEPLNAGMVIRKDNISYTTDGLKAFGGGLELMFKGIVNTMTKITAEMLTLGMTSGKDFRVIRSRQDEFLRRLALRCGIVQSAFFEELPASSADPRGYLQRLGDKQVARFHHSGNMLSVVTDQSRIAVMKRSILALEQSADDILSKHNMAAPGTSIMSVMTPLQMQLFRNLGIPDAKLQRFLPFCLTIRSLSNGDLSTIPESQMDSIIQQAVGNAYEGDDMSRLYANALNRWNSMIIQRNFAATQQHARAVIDRQIGVFAGSMMFYLTHYNSSFARNIILPQYTGIKNSFKDRHTKNRISGIMEPLKYQKIGDYETDIRYPTAGITNTMRVLPPMILAIALSSYANIQIRELRHQLRPNPSLTMADERTPFVKFMAGVDAAGWLGNLSYPINVVNAVRYNRESAQIAAGPLFGGFASLLDLWKNEYSLRNSPNTPTAERAFAKGLYDYVLRPSMQIAVGAATPVSDVGNMLNFAMTQYVGQPTVREAFMRWFAKDSGNMGRKVPTDKHTLDILLRDGKITRQQHESAVRERKLYEIEDERNRIYKRTP